LEIDDGLRTAREGNAIPGVVAMAASKKDVLYHGVFGVSDAATGRALREDDIFRIASMTKPITSVAAMQLVGQGRLGLEDPVQKYLPEFAKVEIFESFDHATGAYKLRPATKSVTIRHLLTHTSGIGYDFTSPILRDFQPRAGETYPVGPFLFEPGEQWHYGLSLDQGLGRVIEEISGQALEDYFRENIFVPLGMADTAYNVPKEKTDRLIPNHRRQGNGMILRGQFPPNPSVQLPRGGGGLASTAADYVRFARMILNDGVLEGARVLQAETIAQMTKNQIGELSARALKTAMPERSADFNFIAEGRDKWGLGFLITVDQLPGKRLAGSLSWGGLNNTFFWIDRARDITGVIYMQFQPFADPKALALYDAFERGVYRLLA